MATLMKPEYAVQLPAHSRVKNSYEALYFGVGSGDIETDVILKDHIPQAFGIEGVYLSETQDSEELKDVFNEAFISTAQTINRGALTEAQIQTMERDFDTFTTNRPNYYEKTFKHYENKHGVPVDHMNDTMKEMKAEYDRLYSDTHEDATSDLDTGLEGADVHMLTIDNEIAVESQIRGHYESMYYGLTPTGTESDEIVKDELQRAFKTHDLVLHDEPDKNRLNQVMLEGYTKSAEKIQGSELSPEQLRKIEQDFTNFSNSQPDFHDMSFKSFENQYSGETIDFSADYERHLQEIDEPEVTGEALDAMEQEFNESRVEQSAPSQSGLSYSGHAPEAVARPTRKTYVEKQAEAQAIEALKGNDYDKEYDAYANNRHGNQTPFTAGDDYGFDEPELEDDGPEL